MAGGRRREADVTYGALRGIGFRLDPEMAHHVALGAIRTMRPVPRRKVTDPVEVFGLRFTNRVGLAAGYDKDGVAWRALAGLGFGHIEIGTVTPLPQPGHPRPRIHRYPDHQALINRMGFPSEGAEAVAHRLGGRRPHDVVLGASIGPNAETPKDRRIDDYLTLVNRFRGLVDYLAVNVSSPNTAGLRELEGAPLEQVLTAVRQRAGDTPVLVKLSPDLTDVAAAVAAVESAGIAGIIMGNTTLARPFDGAAAAGGVSGAPLGPLAMAALDRVIAATRLPVISCGGIMSGADAGHRFAAGAALVQLYTGLVYRGPRLVREAARSRQGA